MSDEPHLVNLHGPGREEITRELADAVLIVHESVSPVRDAYASGVLAALSWVLGISEPPLQGVA